MKLKTAKIVRGVAKIALLLCLLSLLGLGIFFTYKSVKFKPYKVRVSNVTDSAFTVSWVTDEPMVGVVYYGEKDNFLPGPLAWIGKSKAVDDRDVSNAQTECVSEFNKKASKNRDDNFTIDIEGYDCNNVKVSKRGQYYTHHITVQNLEAEKEYFFRVGDGYISYVKGKTDGVEYIEREMSAVEVFSQKTLPVINDVSSPNPAYGTSYNLFYSKDGQVGMKKNFDAIIFLKTFKEGVEYPLMSAVSNNDGGWSIDYANVRDFEGKTLGMENTYVEFIPQVENARPGASGTSRFEDTEYPLNLMGNNMDDLGEQESVSAGAASYIKNMFVRDIEAVDLAAGGGSCYCVSKNCTYVKKSLCSGTCLASQATCKGQLQDKTPEVVTIPCYKCNGASLETKYFDKNKGCGAGYSSGKLKCSSPTVTQITCWNSEGKSKKVDGTKCSGAFPLTSEPLFKDEPEQPRVGERRTCYYPNGSTCKSVLKVSCEGMFELETLCNNFAKNSIPNCSDRSQLIEGQIVRGACQGSIAKCYIPLYRKNANGTKGALCQNLAMEGVNCGTYHCEDPKSKPAIGWGQKCTNGGGCVCPEDSKGYARAVAYNVSCPAKDGGKTNLATGGKCTDPDGCICTASNPQKSEIDLGEICTGEKNSVQVIAFGIPCTNATCRCPANAKASTVTRGNSCESKAVGSCKEESLELSDYRSLCNAKRCLCPQNSYDVREFVSCGERCPNRESPTSSVLPNFTQRCAFDTCSCPANSVSPSVKRTEICKRNNLNKCWDVSKNCKETTSGCFNLNSGTLKNGMYASAASCDAASKREIFCWKETSTGAGYGNFPSICKQITKLANLCDSSAGEYANKDSCEKAKTGSCWQIRGSGKTCTEVSGDKCYSSFGTLLSGSHLTKDACQIQEKKGGNYCWTMPPRHSNDNRIPESTGCYETVVPSNQCSPKLGTYATKELCEQNSKEDATKKSCYKHAAGGVCNRYTKDCYTSAANLAFDAYEDSAKGKEQCEANAKNDNYCFKAESVGRGYSSCYPTKTPVGHCNQAQGEYENIQACLNVVSGNSCYFAEGKNCNKKSAKECYTASGALVGNAYSTYTKCKSAMGEDVPDESIIAVPVNPVNEDLNPTLKDNSSMVCCGGEFKPSSECSLIINRDPSLCISFSPVMLPEICVPDNRDIGSTYSMPSYGSCASGSHKSSYLELISKGSMRWEGTLCCCEPGTDRCSLQFGYDTCGSRTTLSTHENCIYNGGGSSSIQQKLVSKTYAADEEQENSTVLYFPEAGIYEINYGSNIQKTTLFSKGGTGFIFYYDRDGEEGYQAPFDPENPLDSEDILIPQSAVVVSTSKVSSARKVPIKKGVNILSFDFLPSLGESEVLMASDFLKIVNSEGEENVSRISYFSGGQWDGGFSYDFGEKKGGGKDFAISFGQGYVLLAERDTVLTIPGYNVESPVPIAFSSGWNLVGVHGYDTQYTANSLINSINTIQGLKSNNVTYWPTSKGMYQGYQLSEGQAYGQDFPISKDLGYFVRISEFNAPDTTCKSIIWNPGGSLNGKCGSNN